MSTDLINWAPTPRQRLLALTLEDKISLLEYSSSPLVLRMLSTDPNPIIRDTIASAHRDFDRQYANDSSPIIRFNIALKTCDNQILWFLSYDSNRAIASIARDRLPWYQRYTSRILYLFKLK